MHQRSPNPAAQTDAANQRETASISNSRKPSNDGSIFVVIGGGQVEGLLAVAQRGTEVLLQHLPGFADRAGGAEPRQGDDTELIVAAGATEPIAARPEAKAALKPVLGLVQVPQPRHSQVGVAEVEGVLGFGRAVADPLV